MQGRLAIVEVSGGVGEQFIETASDGYGPLAMMNWVSQRTPKM